MSSSFRFAAVVNTVLVMAGSVSGKTGTRFAPEQSTLAIRLYDRADAPAQMLHSAMDETSWLFRQARIRISWQCPPTEAPEDQGADMTSAAFQRPNVRPYIVVRLMRRTPANIYPGALGYALPFAHTGAHVLIFYDRVESLARSANVATYLVLGYAVAHEIGHVLLGSSEHASGGMMQARWTPATWRLASSGLLAFSRDEAEQMNAGLQRFKILLPQTLANQSLTRTAANIQPSVPAQSQALSN